MWVWGEGGAPRSVRPRSRATKRVYFRRSTPPAALTPGPVVVQYSTVTSGELGAEWEGGGHERRVVVKFRLY